MTVRPAMSGILCAILFVSAAAAQPVAGNAEAGHRFAEIWCSGCHAVDLKSIRSGGMAPDLGTIADRPGTTPERLAAFLGRPHERMPNFVLDPVETADLIAFIMSLKQAKLR